jgi:hypothetical protein
MAEDFEEEEYGRIERENATIEKEMAWLYDWPGGI